VTIAFEFAGGPYSGMVMKTSTVDAFNASLIYGWYAMTNSGQPGEKFWAAALRHDQQTGQVTGLADQPHYYEVTGREEQNGEVTVRCRCLGTRGPTEP
jgi:hypothetical protein